MERKKSNRFEDHLDEQLYRLVHQPEVMKQ